MPTRAVGTSSTTVSTRLNWNALGRHQRRGAPLGRRGRGHCVGQQQYRGLRRPEPGPLPAGRAIPGHLPQRRDEREQRLQRDGRGAVSGSCRATTWRPVSAHRTVSALATGLTIIPLPVAVSGTQTYGGSPTFSGFASFSGPGTTPPNVTLDTSALTCTTVGNFTTISSTSDAWQLHPAGDVVQRRSPHRGRTLPTTPSSTPRHPTISPSRPSRSTSR